MVPQRVSLITIGVINLPELRAFYKRLGWSETKASTDHYAVFETAGVLLSLFPIEELAKEAGIEISRSIDSFRAGVTLAVNVDSREEVDSACEIVRQAGARILREPCDAFWGGRVAYFADPENNLWEIAWNPTALFDERGAMLSF
ncbi:MAG: glyoxalase [Paenibacillus sp.]|jgi:catechol 2,3-dioxygenase-like lactoylglutathione lyase family enzyme|nr:glyoxalase [Paenibacillus sp.]